MAPFKVPADAYFMLGDARSRSYDSRYWGPVAKKYVRSKVVYLYRPFWEREEKSVMGE